MSTPIGPFVRLSLEVRPNDRELRLPLSIDAPAPIVARALAGVIAAEAERLVTMIESDYLGRVEANRYTIELGVRVSPIESST